MGGTVSVLVVFFIHWAVQSSCQLYEDTDRLHGHLFNASRYNRFVRPIRDQGRAVRVNFSHTLTALESFNVKTGTVILYSYFILRWRDEILAWNPQDYGGIKWLSLPRDRFWRPDLVLAYSGSPNDETNIMDADYTTAFIDHEGNVMMVPAGRFQTRCNVNTVAYPLDRHKCLFSLIEAHYQSSEVELHQEASSPRLYDFFQNNEEWLIEDFTGAHYNQNKHDGITSANIINEFYLKRRPTYELLKTCVPLVLLTVTNLSTFFVPADCGERLSLTVANFLALVFTNFMIMDSLPSNSLHLTIPNVSVLIINILGTFVVFWSIFVVRIYRISLHQNCVPKILRKMIVRKLIRDKASFSSRLSDQLTRPSDVAPSPLTVPNVSLQFKPDTNRNHSRAPEITSIDVTRYLDRCCFLVTIVTLLATMAAYMIYFYNSPDPYVFSPITTSR